MYGDHSTVNLRSFRLSAFEIELLKNILKRVLKNPRRAEARVIEKMNSETMPKDWGWFVPKRRKSVVKGVVFRLFWKYM